MDSKKKEYDLAVGIGFACGVSQALRHAGLQFASFPMDWVMSPGILRSAEVIASDFAHWVDRDALELVDVRRGSGFNTRIYRNRITGFGFVHEFGNFQPFAESYPRVAEMYDRRIARLTHLLASSPHVLLVYLEHPYRSCASRELILRARRLLAEKYPNTSFDLLYAYEDSSCKVSRVVSEEDGVTVLALDYRIFDGGELMHFVRWHVLADYLRQNVTVRDYRSEADRARRQSAFEDAVMCRWGRKGTLRCLANRWAFRIFRHLEKYLMSRGLVQREGPLWFGNREGGDR